MTIEEIKLNQILTNGIQQYMKKKIKTKFSFCEWLIGLILEKKFFLGTAMAYGPREIPRPGIKSEPQL